MPLALVPFPASLPDPLIVASSDTNDIPVCPAVAGKVVRIWGFRLSGGTSAVFKSNQTAKSGVMPMPYGEELVQPRAVFGKVVPYFASEAGETINIKPTASGLAGTVWYSQD